MSLEKAEILEVQEGHIQLGGSRHQTCSKCSLKQGCGQYLFRRDDRLVLDIDQRILSADQQLACRRFSPGDVVDLAMDGNRLTSLVFWFYGVPLAGFLVASATGWLLGFSETGNIISATAGLVLGISVARYYLRHEKSAGYFLPAMVPAENMKRAVPDSGCSEENQ